MTFLMICHNSRQLMRYKSLLPAICAFLFTLLFGLGLFYSDSVRGFFINESQAALQARSQKVKIAVFRLNGHRSLDVDLLNGFLRAYNLNFELFQISDFYLLKQLWSNHQFDMIVGRLPIDESEIDANAGFEYDKLDLSLFCRTKSINEIIVPEEYFQLSQNEIEKFDQLKKGQFRKTSGTAFILLSEATVLAKNGRDSCIVAESKFAKNVSFRKNKFKPVMVFEDSFPVSWQFSESSANLRQLSLIWFNKLNPNNEIRRYWDRVEAHQYNLTLADYRRFKNDITKILPEWKSIFKRNGEEFGVPWLLIAAVAYQESKWNNSAVSYTGVKGMMQLTQLTAKHVGIEDREDAEQSIRGGSYYLKHLYEKTPQQLPLFERWAFTLASYNIGHSHMRDIRRIAAEKNKNPYSWEDLQKLLLLKSDRKLEKQFYFGLARGDETVNFVKSVLSYYDYLKSHYKTGTETSLDQIPNVTQLSPTSRDF
jgi:membrane-bound lytic murein transglycosylase F